MSKSKKYDSDESIKNIPANTNNPDIKAEKKSKEKPLEIPGYMKKTYNWAYIDPRNVNLLDNNFVVWTILWGNSTKLMKAACDEFKPGQKIFMPAHVYGDFVKKLADKVGPTGKFDLIDICPIQVEHGTEKLKDRPWATVTRADASNPPAGKYDSVCCFFLLHEVPDNYKHNVINAMLNKVEPGNKVVFVDYHDPAKWHPLRGFMNFIFRTLEPYTFGLIHSEISNFAEKPDDFTWTKETFFGGLYQKVIATRKTV